MPNKKYKIILYFEGMERVLADMEGKDKLAKRIKYLCKVNNVSYYALSYRSAVPMTTLMHIINCSTKNPGIFTIIKICNGLDITVKEFFDSDEFIDIEYETE